MLVGSNFFNWLIAQGDKRKLASNVHDDLAFTIANEILRDPDADFVKTFVKLLLYLQVSFLRNNLCVSFIFVI
jgi:hypothetical protein